jgi:pilus assembly protein TadC
VSGRTVTTPAGETWRVRRLWVPRMRGETLWSRLRRRIRRARRVGEWSDVGEGCVFDVDDLIILVALAVVILLLVFLVVPLLLVLLDVLVLLLLLVLGLGARIVFRRPWVVEATGSGPYRHTWRVVGWRASGEKVDEIANLLAHGHPLRPDHDTSLRPGHQAPEDAGS